MSAHDLSPTWCLCSSQALSSWWWRKNHGNVFKQKPQIKNWSSQRVVWKYLFQLELAQLEKILGRFTIDCEYYRGLISSFSRDSLCIRQDMTGATRGYLDTTYLTSC
eukprot:TRINITY_DN3552_c0_g1_i22.p1 TRINITY_DN3552_c0_g1~~TRINITY_DN3552_c0_g1_i22.p1  ORF type:complete len:125 (+),score=7.42 TRINITY_DN3552_c0_g1_i22:55-375(+)